MNERWILIQSGVPRGQIKINGSSIYVKGVLHGKVVNFEFKPATSPSEDLPSIEPPTIVTPNVPNSPSVSQQSSSVTSIVSQIRSTKMLPSAGIELGSNSHPSPLSSCPVADKSCSPDNSGSQSTPTSASGNGASLAAPLTASDPGTNSTSRL